MADFNDFGVINDMKSWILKALIILQIGFLIATFFHAGTQYQWIWAIISFIPATIICLYEPERKYVISSLVVLFVSQQAVFIFLSSPWGFTYGSDQINDLHVATVISEATRFDLGKASYAGRPSYSYYPLLHLFSVAMSKISGLPLNMVALCFPIVSTTLTTICLYILNNNLFRLEGTTRNIATLFFGMGFVYANTDSQYIRETFAFPLVLLSLSVLIEATKTRNRNYGFVAFFLIVAIIFSHQVTSYIFFIILMILTLGLRTFQRSSKLVTYFLLLAVVLGSYTSFVVLSFSVTEWRYAFEGIQAIFHREGSYTVLRSYPAWSVYMSYLQYIIFAASSVIGFSRLFQTKKRDWTVLSLIGFFSLAFIISVLLRLSVSTDPWSWTYYMALRGTIWAFLGISVLSAIGIVYVLRLTTIGWKQLFAITLVVCILAVGKFSQFAPIVTDSSRIPLTYDRYVAALWLKGVSTHSLNMLVAPYKVDVDSFEASREMSPYAYLKEYFLEDTGSRTYDKFNGYIPFVGKFFNQYRNSTEVQMIYSNGETQIGLKP
jgi:hypothetical protein